MRPALVEGCLSGQLRLSPITMVWGSGRLAEPPVAQDQPSPLQLSLDPNSFDIALESDGVTVQLVLDLEHLAYLPEEFVVRKPVSHLMGSRPMGIRAENRPQPPQIRGELLDRHTLLVPQFADGLPMCCRRAAPLPPPS